MLRATPLRSNSARILCGPHPARTFSPAKVAAKRLSSRYPNSSNHSTASWTSSSTSPALSRRSLTSLQDLSRASRKRMALSLAEESFLLGPVNSAHPFSGLTPHLWQASATPLQQRRLLRLTLTSCLALLLSVSLVSASPPAELPFFAFSSDDLSGSTIAITFPLISSRVSGLSRRNCLAFSRPWPRRSSS